VGLAQIWDIIWQNEPFHWAVAAVLIVAVIVEVYTLLDYWYSECGITEAAVKFLRKLQRNKNSQLLQPPNQISFWLKEHLGTDDSSRLRQQNSKFVLIEYPEVLARPVPRSSLRFVTTLCTAIGVLGTFYGIQEGLQGINLDTTSFEQLLPAIKQLLAGMKTAFSTSLMGLGSGSLFTLVLFVCDSLRQKRRHSLRKSLNAIAFLKTGDNEIGKTAAEFKLLAENLSNLNLPSADAIGQAVGKSIAETFGGLNQFLSGDEQMRSLILPELKTIFQEQQKLLEHQENQRHRVLEELIRDLRVEVIEPIANKLDKSAELTQQASEAVQTLHQELGGISQSLANSIGTIQNFQQNTLMSLQDFAASLKQTLQQFQTETKGVLQLTAQDINRAVEQSIQGMTAQRAAFEASANQAATIFQGIRAELETALKLQSEIQQQMLEDTKTGIIEILNQANADFEHQTHILKTIGNQASGLMNEASEHLLTTLGNADFLVAARTNSDISNGKKHHE
jgi:hypothetical protein